MKKSIFILTASLFLVLFSCRENKDESKEKIEEEATTEEPTLKVKINAKVLVDDVFEVYYYETGQQTFHHEDFVFTKVDGDSLFQDIVFELPEITYPERLRLDLGKNTNQKEIELRAITLSYGEKEYNFSKEEIENEFKPSKFIDFNKETRIIKMKEINGKYDPYFYSPKVSNIVNYLLED
tara:strand:- start:18726 stop:19268 length:543 start_codon:yes stop_codon:yes gene_type:complete